jgi:hypothetical protein
MIYKNKKIFLLSLIAVLAVLYAVSFVFDTERNNTRSASFVWLDPKLGEAADKIVINTGWEIIELFMKNGSWFVTQKQTIPAQYMEIFGEGFELPPQEVIEYPARRRRIEDFVGIFTTRALWPVRSANVSSHSLFGLDDNAFRITIYENNFAVLDLLMGNSENSADVYLRRYAQNEVRSGEDIISTYITSPITSWYNLRLLPESEDGLLDVADVQRISIYNEGENYAFSRQNRRWVVSGASLTEPDQLNIDSFIRAVLNSEGDDFSADVSADDPVLNHSRITLEFGNGSVKTIRVSAPDEVNKRVAHVSGSGYVYSIPLWVSVRILRSASSFETQ